MNFIERKFKQLMEQSDLEEKLRDRYGSQAQPFRWKEFREFETTRDAQKYALRSLQQIGQGSSRRVFVLSSRYVLKVAMKDAGRAQNLFEYKLSNDPTVSPVLAKVHDADPKGLWLVSDLVKPLNSYAPGEFHRVMGFDLVALAKGGGYPERNLRLAKGDIAMAKKQLGILDQNPEIDDDGMRRAHWEGELERLTTDIADLEQKLAAEKERNKSTKFGQYKKALDYAVDEFGMSEGDTFSAGHWGKTPDGRIVFLDYGLSEDIWDEFYT